MLTVVDQVMALQICQLRKRFVANGAAKGDVENINSECWQAWTSEARHRRQDLSFFFSLRNFSYHTKGRSPECALVCFHTLLWLGKCFPHSSHLYLLSVKCFAWWATISSLVSKRCQRREREIQRLGRRVWVKIFPIIRWRLRRRRNFSTCTMLTEKKKNWSTKRKKNRTTNIESNQMYMKCSLRVYNNIGSSSKKKGKAGEMERLMLGCLGRLTNESMAATTKKKASKHTPAGERHGEKAKFFFYIFFGRIRTSKKRVWGKKPTHTHAEGKASRQAQRKERRKKKIGWGWRGEEEEVHYILYQKHIFKVNSQPKKNHFRMWAFSSFSCRPNRIEISFVPFMLSFNCWLLCPHENGKKELKDGDDGEEDVKLN